MWMDNNTQVAFEKLTNGDVNLLKDILSTATNPKLATESQLGVVLHKAIRDLVQQVDATPNHQQSISDCPAPAHQTPIELFEPFKMDGCTAEYEQDPNHVALPHTASQKEILEEQTPPNEPKLDMDKDTQNVDELRHQLMLTNAAAEQAAARLSTVQHQLAKAQETNRCQKSCLQQREKAVIEMKVELAQSKCRTRGALISQRLHTFNDARNDDLRKHEGWKMHAEVLREKGQELSKLEKQVEVLNSTEEQLQTQIFDMEDEVLLLEARHDSSVLEKLQAVQNQITNSDREAQQLRERLAQEIEANKKLKGRQDMDVKVATRSSVNLKPTITDLLQKSVPQPTSSRQHSGCQHLRAQQNMQSSESVGTCVSNASSKQSIMHSGRSLLAIPVSCGPSKLQPERQSIYFSKSVKTSVSGTSPSFAPVQTKERAASKVRTGSLLASSFQVRRASRLSLITA